MKFDPVEILLMSVVPARVYEYCRQLVLEQSQDAKCCGAPGCSIARRVTRLGLNVVAMSSLRWDWSASMLERGRMFVGLSDRQGMKTCQSSLPIPVE